VGSEIYILSTRSCKGGTHTLGDVLCGKEQQKGASPASHGDHRGGEAEFVLLARPSHDMVLLDPA